MTWLWLTVACIFLLAFIGSVWQQGGVLLVWRVENSQLNPGAGSGDPDAPGGVGEGKLVTEFAVRVRSEAEAEAAGVLIARLHRALHGGFDREA